MCADASSILCEDKSPNLYDDTSSGIYAVINDATKNTSSQYAIPARIPTATQKELKIEASAGPRLCCKENISTKTSLNKSLDFEVVKQETKKSIKTSFCPVKFSLAIVFVFALIVVVSMVIALFLQMRTLHYMNRELQKSVEKLNHDKNEFTEQSNVYNLVLSMKNEIKKFNISFVNLSESVNDFFAAQEKFNRELITSVSPILNFYYSSCSDIARGNSYASGNYKVRSSDGVLRNVYCDMNRTFGGNFTGWMRVAELDVNNCPPGLRRELTNSVNTCIVIEDNAGCTEIIYPVYNMKYTQITGRIRGYQIRSSDGFVFTNKSIPRPRDFTDLDNNYLDGVSISTKCQHVWSFAAGCNCSIVLKKPTVIGQDYICDGVQGVQARQHTELLWASQQCGRNSTWFYKVLSPTTIDIKVRICRDQERMDEDLAIKALELYIQ